MSASASIEAGDVPLGRSAVAVSVYRLRNGQYELLPNIRVQSIQSREGADPGVARFRYVFDASNPPSDPTTFEQALSVDSDLNGVVQNDDRLVVMTAYPDGSPLILFDGFAQVPELSLSSAQELVTFSSFGVAVREWDTPIGGAVIRDSINPMTGPDVETDLITYFNPHGRPNATPVGADAKNENGNLFPTFLDPLVLRNPDVRRTWTLPMAVRYLCYHENSDQTYILNPAGDAIDALLDSRGPDLGVGLVQDGSSPVESGPIEVPDYPATGKAWPNVLEDLLRPNGFGIAFRLETGDDGSAFTTLELFRRQDNSPAVAKDLFLQPRGSALDPARTNISGARLARDMTGVANASDFLNRYPCGMPNLRLNRLSVKSYGVSNCNSMCHSQSRCHRQNITPPCYSRPIAATSNTVSSDTQAPSSRSPTGHRILRSSRSRSEAGGWRVFRNVAAKPRKNGRTNRTRSHAGIRG